MIEQLPTASTAADTTPEGRQTRAQVDAWCDRVKHAKEHHEEAFERMREDMRFARGLQWEGQTALKDHRYVANIVQRHLRQREAALYAKNPRAVAHRRDTLDFVLWDGDPASLQVAQQTVLVAQQAMEATQGDPQAMLQLEPMMAHVQQANALLQDVQQGQQRRQQITAMGKTLEIVWQHQIGEQQPPFKASMKQLVRRALTTGVGYVKLGFHRFEEYRPEDVERVTDLTEQIAALQAALAKEADPRTDKSDDRAELAELQQLLDKVTGEQEAFVREGLDFDFPRATSLIVDPQCTHVQNFVAARWVAQEYLLTTQQVREIYQVDVADDYTPFSPDGKEMSREVFEDRKDGKPTDTRALVWEIWDKHTAQTFTVCEGHPAYLIAPKTPDVNLETFWPYFVLTFNGLEDEEQIYPPSDVRLIRHMQQERNIMRQRLREHRDAARPGHVAPRGKLDDEDKAALGNRDSHTIVELNGLAEGDDVRKVLQPIPVNPIDPNQYEVQGLQDDIYQVVGTQEAVLGGASGATATETSIAESSRLSAIGSAVDELDDLLTHMAKSASQLLLVEMSAERVQEIAGVGAVWPQLSAGEVAQDLWLEVRAGSSGRPNKSAELQNLERMLPYLIQIPGLKPMWLAEQIIERLDDRIDIKDAIDPMLPSIANMNRQTQVAGPGGEESDPNAQGDEGGDKTSVEQGDSNMGGRPPPEERNMDPNRR